MHHTGYWGLSYTTTNITLLEGLRNSASYWLLGTQLYYNKYHNATESEEQSITMVTLVPSLIWSLLAFTTSPSLILPGTLDSFLTQKCPWRSTSAKLLTSSLNVLVQSAGFSLKMQPRLRLVTSSILSRLDYCNCLLMGTPNSVIQPLQKLNSKLCFKTRSLGTPSPPLNTSPGKTALVSHFRTY